MNFLPFLLVLINVISCTSISPKPSDNDIAGRYHRVKKGESLGQIARRYRSKTDELMEVNGIEHEKSLRVGQEVFIPDPDPIGTRIKKHRTSTPTKIAQRSTTASSKKIFDFPAQGTIFRHFSSSKQKPYDGIGIKAPLGTPVIAGLDGKVIFAGDDGTRYGLLVIIEHQAPYISVYAHLNKARVTIGQQVKKRDIIGQVGTSGGITTPHLHFQIRVNERPQNPENYIAMPHAKSK